MIPPCGDRFPNEGPSCDFIQIQLGRIRDALSGPQQQMTAKQQRLQLVRTVQRATRDLLIFPFIGRRSVVPLSHVSSIVYHLGKFRKRGKVARWKFLRR
ncbi:hypothetical protein WJ13_18460 [Burkholderia seminalis]|nr:hypothetical protein WJ13_18460 [Burkholderia seminalis]